MATTTSARTVIGPLTTVFTPPSSCFSLVDAPPGPWGSEVAFQALTCPPASHGWLDDAACWPLLGKSTTPSNMLGLGFYSPGLICPSGYTTACSKTMLSNISTPIQSQYFEFQYPLNLGETAVGCCPRYCLFTSCSVPPLF